MIAAKRRAKVQTKRVPALRELQELFQRAILEAKAMPAQVLASSKASRKTLFGVYRHAYSARLVEVLGNDHECLRAYVGEGAFDTLGRAYVAACPSRHTNVRWWARDLPE